MLAALMYAHGLVMNGGVLHAVEIMEDTELADAMSAYKFYSLTAVADLLSRAKTQLRSLTHIGRHEASLDAEYKTWIPSDARLSQLVDQHRADKASDFAPVLPDAPEVLMDIDIIVNRFREAAIAKASCDVTRDHELHRIMKEAFAQLRSKGLEGRAAFRGLLGDESPEVVCWVAAQFLYESGLPEARKALRGSDKTSGKSRKNRKPPRFCQSL